MITFRLSNPQVVELLAATAYKVLVRPNLSSLPFVMSVDMVFPATNTPAFQHHTDDTVGVSFSCTLKVGKPSWTSPPLGVGIGLPDTTKSLRDNFCSVVKAFQDLENKYGTFEGSLRLQLPQRNPQAAGSAPVDPSKEGSPVDKARDMRRKDELSAELWLPHAFVSMVAKTAREAKAALQVLGEVPEGEEGPPGRAKPASEAETFPVEPKLPSLDGALSSIVQLCKAAAQYADR